MRKTLSNQYIQDQEAMFEAMDSISTLSQGILVTILLAGTLAVSAVAPNTLQLLKYLPKAARIYNRFRNKRTFSAAQIQQIVYHLKRSGQIESFKKDNRAYFRVTQKGDERSKGLIIRNITIGVPKKWDGNYWFVMSDIPVGFRYKADKFRNQMKRLKFFQFQKSVWVYPFDPRKVIEIISSVCDVQNYVTCLKVESINSAGLQKTSFYFKKLGLI